MADQDPFAQAASELKNPNPTPQPAAAPSATTPTPTAGGDPFAQAAKELGQTTTTTETMPETAPPIRVSPDSLAHYDNQHFTAKGPNVGTISAPSTWEQIKDRVENVFRYANPNTRPNIQPEDKAANQAGDMTLFRLQELLSPEEREKSPEADVGLSAVSSLTSPVNAMIMLGTSGFGAVKALSYVGRGIAMGFSIQQIMGAFESSKELREAWNKGDELGVRRAFAKTMFDLAFAGAAAHGAVTGGVERGGASDYEANIRDRVATGFDPDKPLTPEAREATENMRKGFAAYEQKTAGIQEAAAKEAAVEPQPEQGGTVKGPRTTLRPTTQTTAGVTAPVSAAQQENPSLATQIAGKFTTPGAAEQFRQEQTAPAARRQLVSAISQRAEDANNTHMSLVNNEPLKGQVAGTQQIGKYQTVDEMQNGLYNTAHNTTYAKADAASKADMADWQHQVDAITAREKEAVEHYNSLVDEHNANLKEGEEPLQKQAFDPARVQLPERPVTFSEVQSALQSAKAATGSPDPVVRDKAFNEDLPEAQKNFDKWFKDHNDQISDGEYKSAKNLIWMSERYGEIANYFRGNFLNNNLTGNRMRSLEAVMDNRRGAGTFRRLLGDETYNNYREVARLFDPAKKGAPSMGQYAVEYVLAHLIPHTVPIKVATELLLNKVMFNTMWGG